ncbi:MAG: septum formation initiator family protein [Patescibacteria group bacterium]|nr:septum formation initiator family protein [Patescibacteria group bacterium]
MAQFKKKDKSKFWHSPIMLLLIFCVLVLFIYNVQGLFEKEIETNKNKVAELNKINDLRKREDSLQSDINKLNTTQGVEESIRDKFQVVKPGENMVVIVNDGENNNVSTPTNTSHSFWDYVKKFFGK